MTAALKLISAPVRLLEVPGSGHELLPRNPVGDVAEVPERILNAFQEFFR
jgi:hypothetical protein